MTVTTTINRNNYTGDGALKTFAYNFKILADTNLRVYIDLILQTLTTHYTVTGAGNPDGGNVVFVTAPASAMSIVIIRAVPENQLTDYVDNDSLPAATLEDEADKNVMLVQQHSEKFDRVIKVAEASLKTGLILPEPGGGKYIRWKTDGTSLELVDVATGSVLQVIVAKGDLIRGGTGGIPERLALGTEGDVLKIVSGVPAYASAAPLPTGYRQGWKMKNNGTDAVNDLDITAGKARNNDDDGDMSTSTLTTLQMDVTGAGGRQSATAIPDGTWFDIYMISGSGQTTKPFAVRESLSVTLPSGYTDYAHIGYWYWVDGTVGLIPAVHEENGWVWFKDNYIEDLDSTGSATSFTDINLSVHTDLVLPILSLLSTKPGSAAGAKSGERSVYFRPDGSSWAGQTVSRGNNDPVEALSLSVGYSNEGIVQDQSYWGPFPAPGGIIEWMSQHSTAVRTRVYVAGFFNGHFIK